MMSVHSLCILHNPNSFLHFIVAESIADDFGKSKVLAFRYRIKVASFNAKPQQSPAGKADLIFSNASFCSLVKSTMMMDDKMKKENSWFVQFLELKLSVHLDNLLIECEDLQTSADYPDVEPSRLSKFLTRT